MFVGCACITGFPVCQEGWTLQNNQLPGACCPDYKCVENGKYPIAFNYTKLFQFKSCFCYSVHLPVFAYLTMYSFSFQFVTLVNTTLCQTILVRIVSVEVMGIQPMTVVKLCVT